jgi:hypothetical protein
MPQLRRPRRALRTGALAQVDRLPIQGPVAGVAIRAHRVDPFGVAPLTRTARQTVLGAVGKPWICAPSASNVLRCAETRRSGCFGTVWDVPKQPRGRAEVALVGETAWTRRKATAIGVQPIECHHSRPSIVSRAACKIDTRTAAWFVTAYWQTTPARMARLPHRAPMDRTPAMKTQKRPSTGR